MSHVKNGNYTLVWSLENAVLKLATASLELSQSILKKESKLALQNVPTIS